MLRSTGAPKNYGFTYLFIIVAIAEDRDLKFGQHVGFVTSIMTSISLCVYVLCQGALVDQYGPGTVFHHIKQQRLRPRNDSFDEYLTGTPVLVRH